MSTSYINNNLSDNLIRINGEYVKFYATTNSALPNIMRNTGAMIIYQDNSYSSYMRRSLYLANNFIASGYGVYSEDNRNYLESISDYTYSGKRWLTYELDNIKSDIEVVEDTFNYYVKADGGNISNTIINIPNNGNLIGATAYDFAQMLKPAEYEDVHITGFYAYMTYELDFVSDISASSIRHTVEKNKAVIEIDEETINKFDSKTETKFKVPKGSRVSNVYFYTYTDNGSTGGFLIYNNLGTTSNEVKYQFDITQGGLIMKDSGEFVPGIYSSTNLQKTLPYFQLLNSGTMKYKPYPMLEEKYGNKYISYENVIPPHLTYICNVTYVGTQIMKHTFVNNKLTNVIDIYNDKWDYIDNENSEFLCDKNSSYLYFSIPSNYDILKCNIRRQYDRLGNQSYYNYNVTGDIYEIMDTHTSDIDLSYNNMFITKTTYTECRNYYMRYNFNENDLISLDFYKVYNDLEMKDGYSNEGIYFNPSIINGHNNIKCSSYFLQDSEFNSNHWFNPDELPYIQRN